MRLTSNQHCTEGNAQGMTVRIARLVCRGLALCLATALLPSVLSAQSILNFPRVISSDQVFTGIAVGNPTPNMVTVTFTAFVADGSLVAGGGVENPTTKMIAAGGQLARQYSELFGSADFNGWVQATSASGGLTGFFLNANPATDGPGRSAGAVGRGQVRVAFCRRGCDREDRADGGEPGRRVGNGDADALWQRWVGAGNGGR